MQKDDQQLPQKSSFDLLPCYHHPSVYISVYITRKLVGGWFKVYFKSYFVNYTYMVCNYISWNRNFGEWNWSNKWKPGVVKEANNWLWRRKIWYVGNICHDLKFWWSSTFHVFYEMCPHILHIISKRDWFCLDSSNCVHFWCNNFCDSCRY